MGDETLINASPTKEFFIHMLTRDVALSRAITDLVDNAVDGARRERDDTNYHGLHCRLTLSPDSFVIEDNCGGIPVDIARNYAFRFGRPADAPNTQHSVGQFGVGMKRTFFKLGKNITVTSATRTSRFTMHVDVDKWVTNKDPVDQWHFEFSSLDENIEVPEGEVGTTIKIEALLPEAKQSFGLQTFLKSLETSLAQDHALMIEKGMSLALNGIHITHFPLEILQSDKIAPASIEKVYYEGEASPVSVRILVGLSNRSKEDGGWYVFCNGRMVMKADQSITTGWGEGDSSRMPKYHPDFAFFRGYVFFDCKDASRLPWTTTKTGVDIDAWIFRAVREEMIEAARPALRFLRDMAKEKAEAIQGDRPGSELENSWQEGKSVRIDSVQSNPAFNAPVSKPIEGPRYQKIQYARIAEHVDEVKKHLGVRSFTDVGIRTFEYYRQYEMNADDA